MKKKKKVGSERKEKKKNDTDLNSKEKPNPQFQEMTRSPRQLEIKKIKKIKNN